MLLGRWLTGLGTAIRELVEHALTSSAGSSMR